MTQIEKYIERLKTLQNLYKEGQPQHNAFGIAITEVNEMLIKNLNMENKVSVATEPQHDAKLPVMRRFRVNMLHRGKERWKYCRTIERAKKLQQEATAGGLCSIIYEKADKGYVAWNGV